MEAESSINGVPGAKEASRILSGLSAVVSAIVAADRGIAQLQAGRELLLAMAAELSHGLIDGGPTGHEDAFRDSRALELAERSVAAEIATATRTSDRSVQHQMGEAVELMSLFPATFDALSEGRISLAHVRVIRDAGIVIDDRAARAHYEAAVLAAAEVQAPGRVRRIAAREAEKVRPEPLEVRHDRACEQRRVWLNPLPDGMAELGAVLSATLAHGVFNRLTRMAKARVNAVTESGTTEARTRDQLRADLLTDLLLHGAPTGRDTPDGLLAGINARVEVTIPVLTLIGAGAGSENSSGEDDDLPAPQRAGLVDMPVAGELNGRHPIDPHTARLLAGDVSVWNRILTDPITGAVLAVDRYRPSEDLKRFLRARDRRCRFPGCTIPAAELDLDHTQDAAHGGPTELANLAGLCRRHHTLKHQTPWAVRQTATQPGTLEWTSPTGRRHRDRPPTPATHTVPDRGHAGPDPDPPGKPGNGGPGESDPPPF